MVKSIKSFISLTLAALMALAIPVTAFASGMDMTLVINTEGDCYAGVTYDVVATVNNVESDKIIGNEATQSAFTWSTFNGETISTTNDYSIKENADGTYTVSETAKIVLPETLGTTKIKASYGDLIYKTISVSTHQAITGISVDAENDADKFWLKKSSDSSEDVLYIDYYSNGKVDCTFTPDTNEDDYVVTHNGIEPSYVSKLGNSFEIDARPLADKTGFLENHIFVISPQSGYKVTKKLNVTVCRAFDYIQFYANDNTVEPAVDTRENFTGTVSGTAGDSIRIHPEGAPGNANDSIKYTLYTDSTLSTLAPSSYITVEEETKDCYLNIANPGTYYLKANNVSKGGYLNRYISVIITVTVNEANPITDLKLCNLDSSGNIDQSSTLDEITLYTKSKKQYDLSKNVLITPLGFSHNVKYTSDDKTIATIDPDTGIINAVSNGTTTVSVYSEKNPDVIATCKVKVIKELSSIDKIDSETYTVPQGHTVQLSAVVNPADSNEKIRWSSVDPDALKIDVNGNAFADPSFDLGDKDKYQVLVTATSESGKQQQQFITIVPDIPSTVVKVSATGKEEIFTDLGNDTYTSFEGEPFTLSAVGTNANGVATNEIFRWAATYNNSSQFSFTGDTYEEYFSKEYDSATDTYTITPKKTGNYTFFCYSVKRGQSPTDETVFGIAVVNVVGKAKSIQIYNPNNNNIAYSSDVVPTGDSIDIAFSMNPLGAEKNDPAVLTSSDENIATVVKTSETTATIKAGDVQGNATITVRSKSGKAYAMFKVTVSNNINFADVFGIDGEYEYTGSDIKPVPTLTYNGAKLINNVDYVISDYAYQNCKNVGMASVTISGRGNFNNSSKVVYYSIVPKEIDKERFEIVTLDENIKITADNKAPIPTYYVRDKETGRNLLEGTDFTVDAINNTAPGTATAIITGVGNYKGIVQCDYTIGGSLATATISSIPNQKYTGSAIKPSVKVVLEGEVLKAGTDYTISYSNNTQIGKASAVITGKGRFTGTKTVYFNIIPADVKGFKTSARTNTSITLKWTTVSNVTGYQIYDIQGKKIVKTITNKATATYTVTKLAIMKPYSYKIRAYKTVNGVSYYGNYSAIHYTYTIPTTPSLSISTGSKYVKASWKKISSVSGYQVQISTKSNFSGATTYKTSATATSKKITGLKKGKKYYVRVRAYRTLTINGNKTTTYSKWKSSSITCK